MTKIPDFKSYGDLFNNEDSIDSKSMSIDTMKSMYDNLVQKYVEDKTYHNYPGQYVTTPVMPTYNPGHYTTPVNYTWKINLNDYHTYHISPQVTKSDSKVEVTMDDGSVEHVTREELVKYIGERKLVQENEVVRKMYDRFQVAAKLARSDDNGDTGV